MTDELLHKLILETLRDAGRPLSPRRVYRILAPEHDEDIFTFERLKAAIDDAVDAGSVMRGRRGIVSVHDDPLDGPNGGSDPRARPAKSRRPSRRKLAEMGFPAAPISLDETAALSAQSRNRNQLGEMLWRRMRRRAAEVAGMPIEETLDLAGASSSEGELFDLIDGVTAQALSPDVTEHSEGSLGFGRDASAGDERGRFRAKSRTGPYRERRKSRSPRVPNDSNEERRLSPGRGAAEPAIAGVASLLSILRRRGSPITLRELTGSGAKADGSTAMLRAQVKASNERRHGRGLRPLFRISITDELLLTEWELPPRYEILEEQIVACSTEQGELIKRALLQKTGELSAQAFSALIVMLLSRLGYKNVEAQKTEKGGTKLFEYSASRPRGAADTLVLVQARQSWEPLTESAAARFSDSVRELGGDGVLFTVGTLSSDALTIADKDHDTLWFVDGQGLAALLYEQEVGVVSHLKPSKYLDGGLFESLGR